MNLDEESVIQKAADFCGDDARARRRYEEQPIAEFGTARLGNL